MQYDTISQCRGVAARSCSHAAVTGITARLAGIWHKRCIMSVGEQCQILKTSAVFKACLAEVGKNEHFPEADILFRETGHNAGVFLVVKGKVCLSIKSMPNLDRIFGSRSLLGLPATFNRRPYSVTATAVTEADVVHVAQEEFLSLMRERPDLCREAIEILGREMTFIQAALAGPKANCAPRVSGGDITVVHRANIGQPP